MAASAGKRLARTAVDWAKFSDLVPADQRGAFAAFQGAANRYAKKVDALPEALPTIDFDNYKSRAPAAAALIDQFQKQYAGLEVAYPKDTKNRLAEVTEQEKVVKKDVADFIAKSEDKIDEFDALLSRWRVLPPLDQMTKEEWMVYFPDIYFQNDHVQYRSPFVDEKKFMMRTPGIPEEVRQLMVTMNDNYMVRCHVGDESEWDEFMAELREKQKVEAAGGKFDGYYIKGDSNEYYVPEEKLSYA